MADEHETKLRHYVEHRMFAALAAALSGDQAEVRRHVRAVVGVDPVAAAPVVMAADRLIAQLLDGVPVADPTPDARLQPALDFTALAAAAGDTNPVELVGTALPVVTDLLTAAALNPAGEQAITDRLRREPALAHDVLYLMVVASAQRLVVAQRPGDQTCQAHADEHPGRDDS